MDRSSIALIGIVMIVQALTGCSSEKRAVGPALPQIRPAGSSDPRIATFENNVYQVSQGGRYFTWYGCGRCHRNGSTAAPDLASGQWHNGGHFDEVYTSIAEGRGWAKHAYGTVIPGEQLWQLTAFVRSLPDTDAAKVRRQNNDMADEPHAAR
jgi:cytochrome c oxidase cbb3-type subunit 3